MPDVPNESPVTSDGVPPSDEGSLPPVTVDGVPLQEAGTQVQETPPVDLAQALAYTEAQLAESSEQNPAPDIASPPVSPAWATEQPPREDAVQGPRTLGDLVESSAVDLTSTPPVQPSPIPLNDSVNPSTAPPVVSAPSEGDLPLEGPSPEPPPVDIPVAPEDEVLVHRSRLLSILISFLVMVVVVGGAALLAWKYPTALKLPKLPFMKEPESAAPQPAPVESPVDQAIPVVPQSTPPAQSPSSGNSPDTTKGGEPVVPVSNRPAQPLASGLPDSTWKTYSSSKWNYSFQYPPSWYLYARDTGSLGETTMVAAKPLPGLDNDLRQLAIKESDMVVGFSVLTQDKPANTPLLQYLKDSAYQYGIGAPEVSRMRGEPVVRALSTQGNVLYYYMEQGSTVYAISLKPATFTAGFADPIEAIVTSFTFTP